MVNENEIIVGQVTGVFGNSLFGVNINGNRTVKAKLIGAITDIRRKMKIKNELRKGDIVTMTKLDYKLNGNVYYLIYNKLSKKDKFNIYVEKENKYGSTNEDMFSDDEKDIDNDEIDFDSL